MTKENFVNISKSGLERLKELYFSLRIIRDSKILIEDGNFYQVSILYGQLRSLLTDKSKGITPLLFEISEILNKPLQLYYVPDKFEEQLPHIAESISFRLSEFWPSIKKSKKNHEKIEMSEFLDKKVVRHGKSKFSIRKIISELANKYGGAHYSKTTHKYLSEILSFGVNNQPIVDRFIMDLAEITSDLGISLLKSISDIDYYTNLYLTIDETENDIFIFDYKLPHNSNRFSLVLNQKKLYVVVVDTIGFKEVLCIGDYFKYEKVQLLNISFHTSEKFETFIKIYLEGDIVAETHLKSAFLLFNQMKSYDCYYNKSFNGTLQSYEFGLGETMILNKVLEGVEKTELYQHLKSREYSEICWLGTNEYGHSKTEDRDIKMSAGFYKKSINTLPSKM